MDNYVVSVILFQNRDVSVKLLFKLDVGLQQL